jgi:hypothetical protein
MRFMISKKPAQIFRRAKVAMDGALSSTSCANGWFNGSSSKTPCLGRRKLQGERDGPDSRPDGRANKVVLV